MLLFKIFSFISLLVSVYADNLITYKLAHYPPSRIPQTNWTFDSLVQGLKFDASGEVDWNATSSLVINVDAHQRQHDALNPEVHVRRDDQVNLADFVYTSIGEVAYQIDYSSDKGIFYLDVGESQVQKQQKRNYWKFFCAAVGWDINVELINNYMGAPFRGLRYASNQAFWSRAESIPTTLNNFLSMAGQVVGWVQGVSHDGYCGGGTFALYDGSGEKNNQNMLTVGVSAFDVYGGTNCAINVNFYDLEDAVVDCVNDWAQRDVVGGCITISNEARYRGNVRVMHTTMLADRQQNLWDMQCRDL